MEGSSVTTTPRPQCPASLVSPAVLLAFLAGLAMVVAAGVGLAMLIDPQAFVEFSGVDCGDTGDCDDGELRILGGLLAFVGGPIGVWLTLSQAPWRH